MNLRSFSLTRLYSLAAPDLVQRKVKVPQDPEDPQNIEIQSLTA